LNIFVKDVTKYAINATKCISDEYFTIYTRHVQVNLRIFACRDLYSARAFAKLLSRICFRIFSHALLG